MLEAIRGAQKTITFETYIYWSGEIGQQVRRRAVASARAPASRSTSPSTGPAASRWTRRCSSRWRTPACDVQRYRPLHWYNLGRMNNRTHRKLLVVDGTRRLHRRRRHRRPVAGPRAGPGPLARHALPHRRPGGRADAGGVQRQLDQDHAARCSTAPTTSRRSNRAGDMDAHLFISSPAGGSESMHLMYLMAIAAAEHTHRPGRGVLRPRRTDHQGAARGAQARRARAHPACRARTSTRMPARLASQGRLGPAAAGRRRDLRIPADDVPQQDADRGPASWSRWARPTSTSARSGSTTRPASTSTTRPSPSA